MTEIEEIIKQSEPCVVLQCYSRPKEFIEQAYLVLRRNFEGIPLRLAMNESDLKKVDGILSSLAEAIQEVTSYIICCDTFSLHI